MPKLLAAHHRIDSRVPVSCVHWYENGLPTSSFPRRYVPYPPMAGGNPEGWGHQRRPNTFRKGRPFSSLGVPAPAGKSDWYESMTRAPIWDDVSPPRVCPHSEGPPLVVPAPIRHSREGGNPEGRGGGTNDTQLLSARGTHFHTLVCRRQPASAIGTKMMLRCFDSATVSHESPKSSFRRKPESRGEGTGAAS